MTESVLIWAYASPMPFSWCRVFFGLRGHRTLPARWLLASGLALVWPIYWLQYAAWKRRPMPPEPSEPSVGDEIVREFQALYP